MDNDKTNQFDQNPFANKWKKEIEDFQNQINKSSEEINRKMKEFFKKSSDKEQE